MKKYRKETWIFREMAGDEIWGSSIYDPPNASADPLRKEIYGGGKCHFCDEA